MVKIISLFLIAVLIAPALGAQTTQPLPQQPAAPVLPQDAAPRVLVQAFKPIASNLDIPWLGAGIQQSLIADLSVGGLLQPTTDDDGVKYVISGTYQVMDGNLRVSGQIFDAETGKVVGGIKATGQLRDLFMMEDTLSRGARNQILLPGNSNANSGPATNSIANLPNQGQGQQPIIININNSGPVKANTNYAGSDLDRIVQSGQQPSRIYDYAAAYSNYQYSGYDNYYYGGYYPYYGYGFGAYSWGFPRVGFIGNICRPIHWGGGSIGGGVIHHGGGMHGHR